MNKPLTHMIRPDGAPLSLQEYEQKGGYQGLRKAFQFSPEEITQMVTDAELQGRGGAGFSTGIKWSFVPMGKDAPDTKYLVVNGDEMEPGTFKDRLLLEGNPHQMLEGVIISAYAIQAKKAIIFLRWAYKASAERLARAIGEAEQAGYIGKNILNSGFSISVQIHTSVGRYMCGEETGLLSALEGKRALPRAKPPFPQTSGLFGKPTIVNNVETLCCVPHILDKGPKWFKGLSHGDGGRTKLYGASGNVRLPGIYELPLGTPLNELIEVHAGGMREGYQFRAALPGGASTDFLTTEHLEAKMDFKSVIACGSRLGTGTIIVLDDRTCPVGFVHNLEHFFAQESCGWCTPCREGLPWVEKILKSIEDGQGHQDDLGILQEHTVGLGPGMTFCALAPGAMSPLKSALNYFRADFEKHIVEKRCPYRNN
jgi:NADH-quinone oxidoreductase subunit F